MTSVEKLCEALKAIIDDLNENNKNEDIEAIEAENKQLCRKKMELIANINRPSAAVTSIVLVRDMAMRQKNSIQIRFDSKQNSIVRFNDRSREASSETSMLKEKLKGVANFTVSHYHDVLSKVMEFSDKIAEDRSIIDELTEQHSTLVQNVQIDTDEDENENIRFIETLKIVADEQRKLIQKLKGTTVQIKKTNRQPS